MKPIVKLHRVCDTPGGKLQGEFISKRIFSFNGF